MKKWFIYFSYFLYFSAYSETEQVSHESEINIDIPDVTYEDNEELYKQVFGTVKTQKNILIDCIVLIDGEEVGEVPVLIGDDNKIQVAPLKELLEDFLEQRDIAILDKFKNKDGFISFSDLDKLTLKVKLNRLNLKVEFSLPMEKKKTRSLDGRKKIKRKATSTPANISAYLNIRAAETFYKYEKNYNKQNLLLAPVINLWGLCIEGETSYEHYSDSVEKGKFHRDYTTIVYDWVSQDIMFKCGDIYSHSLSYQSAPHVWGINLYKGIERERIEGINSPIQITLLRTSTVEVYSNGSLIRSRTNVAPGTYTFDDLTFNNGGNDIRIKIIDDTGHEQYIDESFFYEGSFVPKGKFTFGGTYGYPEANDKTNGRYDRKHPITSLTFKYGLLSATEISLGMLRNNIGCTNSYGIKNKNILGNFDLKYANSNYKNEKEQRSISGKVHYIQYTTPSFNIFDKTNFMAAISIEKSDNFFKPYASPINSNYLDNIFREEENFYGKNTNTSFSAYISNIFSCNVHTTFSQRKLYDGKKSRNQSFSISRNFNINNDWFSNTNVSLTLDRIKDLDNRNRKAISLYCSLSLKNNISISAGLAKTDDDNSAYISLYHNPENTNFNYEISARKNKNYNNLSLYSHYSHHLFLGNLNYSKNSSGESTANVGLETGLYFADGRYAVAQPNYSDGGFIIVTPRKALANQSLGFVYRNTKSGFLGGGAVIPASRTDFTTAKVDLESLTGNIDIKQDTVSAYGQYKRGFFQDIESEGILTAKGQLLNEQNEPYQQITGYAIHQQDQNAKPIAFFTNEDGEFLLTELQSGKYKLVINVEDVKDIIIEIKEKNNENIIDLGTIICKNTD